MADEGGQAADQRVAYSATGLLIYRIPAEDESGDVAEDLGELAKTAHVEGQADLL